MTQGRDLDEGEVEVGLVLAEIYGACGVALPIKAARAAILALDRYREGRGEEGGRVASPPGSREPSPAVSALTGFDPSRWRLVPVEPTPEMMEALSTAVYEGCGSPSDWMGCEPDTAYKAALAAAPAPYTVTSVEDVTVENLRIVNTAGGGSG